MATSPLASRVPKEGRNSYITPTFSRIPRKGTKNRMGYLTPAFSGGQKRAERLCNARVGNKKRAELLPTNCFLGGPPTKRDTISSGYLTTTFLRA